MKDNLSGHRHPVRRGSVDYSTGGEADHEAVYQTLLHVFHGPDREAFLGTLSDPSYRPDQRLLAKVDGKIASHLHLTERPIRFGSVKLMLNGVMWMATLPEYRGLGFAQNLMRLANLRSMATGAVVQALTTSMPRFYKSLGWGVCGRQSLGIILSRNLPATGGDGLVESRTGAWTVRPWRQVELGDLMRLYDTQYGSTTGTVMRSEEYWRWLIGRRYAHVIWVACQGEQVSGYAFVKDHRVLEVACDPAYPQALSVLLARVRAEALERAYPEVVFHAPSAHPLMDVVRQASGRVLNREEHEGACTMYHIPDPGRFLTAILPVLASRARSQPGLLPVELGLTAGDRRWLLHLGESAARVEPDRLGRRHLTLSEPAFARLALGHTSVDTSMSEDGVEASTQTAIDAARVLFPTQTIWRSPLDNATA